MRPLLFLTGCCCLVLAGFASPVQAGDGTLGWLPEDAVATARFDFKALWRGPLFADMREAILRGGAAQALLQLQMSPRLEEFEEISGAVWQGHDGMPRFLLAISSTGTVDLDKAAQMFLGHGARMEREGAGVIWSHEKQPLFVVAPALDGALLLGSREAVIQALSRKKRPVKPGKLLEGQVAIRLEKNPLSDGLVGAVPEPFTPLVQATTLHLNLAVDAKSITCGLEMAYASEKEAVAAIGATRAAKDLGLKVLNQGKAELRKDMALPDKQMLEHAFAVLGLGGMNLLGQELEKLPIRRTGQLVTATLTIDTMQASPFGPLLSLGLYGYAAQGQLSLQPPSQRAGSAVPTAPEPQMEEMSEEAKPDSPRELASRTRSMNNLRQIGLGIHHFEGTHSFLPPAAVLDKAGKPLYSWRVLLLPHIGEEALYKKWNMDKPWDSPENKALSAMVVKVYADPENPSNKTHYRVFVGDKAGWTASPPGWNPRKPDPKGLFGFAAITDGMSNTLAVVEAKEATPWAAPDAFDYDGKKALPALGVGERKTAAMVMFDASVRQITKDTAEKLLRLYIERADGMPTPEPLK